MSYDILYNRGFLLLIIQCNSIEAVIVTVEISYVLKRGGPSGNGAEIWFEYSTT